MRIGLLRLLLPLIGAGHIACAPAQGPAPRAPDYFRAPRVDYSPPPRSASDGDVIGAHQHPPEDWVLAAPTAEHAAPGWEVRYGRLQFRSERARAGHGFWVEPRICAPPVHTSHLPPHELETRAAAYRAWVEARHPSEAVAVSGAILHVAQTGPSLLDCRH